MMVLEAKYCVSRLLGESSILLNQVIQRCEGWLLDRLSALHTYEGARIFDSKNTDWINRVMDEVNYLRLKTPCPFLSEEKRCLIHIGRPLICRAYGVTRLPVYWCPRPVGKGETRDSKMHAGPPITTDIQEALKKLRQSLDPLDSRYGFAPTLIYMMFRPQTFAKYVHDNKIATAKLLQFGNEPSILDQEQLNAVWEMERLTRSL